ncbi:MerR family transcriptional regulator [Bacillus sp. SD088]|uniref:MerR family transcriptional regulator n=1 Tax=Bacillus sp. SD088 TaxID=2782012 RepID=UPI001A958B99|nr:MerR family transcriptional regulator [Bacillus sp. SD088]MBO0996052.1 MerR family transcriptional regulator [Bacillus sp. SD088]
MVKETFSVSEFAAYTGVSVRTLHYYDEKNILKPKRDTNTGHRVYEKEDTIQLHKIMTLKFLGMTLEDIKEYMHSTTFDLNFIDTLKLQESKLKKDKEQIEIALETIQRTVYVLENEKEVDHAVLVSLLASMQTEKKQQELSKEIIKDEAIQKMFPATAQDKLNWEIGLLTFFKQVRRLSGKPVDHPEVKQMLDDFYRLILELFDMDSFEELAEMFSLDLDDEVNEARFAAYIQEVERLVPTPLTKEEEAWLEQVTFHYMDSSWDEKERRD